MPTISFDTYGKTRVRLTHVRRDGDRHELTDLNVEIFFEGVFEDSFTKADNSIVLPTDTMKNTVYALARQKPIRSVEGFARDLGRHFLGRVPHLEKVRIEIKQTPWERIGASGSAFIQSATERRTTELAATRTSETFVSGIANMQILKTSQSGFAGFLKDEYTTLKETADRLLGTVVQADWIYADAAVDFNKYHAEIRGMLLETFAAHHSLSVQQTVFDMASAILNEFGMISEVHLTMPNKHCLLVDLSPFGLDNPNQVFLPVDEPSGYIEARVRR